MKSLRTHLLSDTPVGPLLLEIRDGALSGLRFQDAGSSGPDVPSAGEGDPLVSRAVRQLEEYFAGARRDFHLPLRPRGTPFQEEVWAALREVPFGERVSYGELARRAGRAGAARAVGAAVGRNPLPILIPCHRVVGADGSLVGFGGGLPRKRILLELEGTTPAE